MSKPTNVFLKLERQIASDERGGIRHRWEYGRELLGAKSGRKISEREIQRRIKCAEVYDHDLKLRQVLTEYGSWTEIVNAGFPEVTVDEDLIDPDDLAAPDEWEQLSLIPGLGETIKVNGRRIPLAEATVADIAAYRDMYAQIHANYEKRLALIEAALSAMRDGSADDSDNAIEAYRRGVA